MTNTEKRELLKRELLKMKAEGFRVFINTPDEQNYYNYGIITDGMYIVYVQFGEYGSTLFTTSFQWVPSRKNGSGCATTEKGCGYKELTKEMFYEAVTYGRSFARQCKAEQYKNIEQYFAVDTYRKNHYIKL